MEDPSSEGDSDYISLPRYRRVQPIQEIELFVPMPSFGIEDPFGSHEKLHRPLPSVCESPNHVYWKFYGF